MYQVVDPVGDDPNPEQTLGNKNRIRIRSSRKKYPDLIVKENGSGSDPYN